MSSQQAHEYVPRVGPPTVIFLTALAAATAFPAAFLVQQRTPPLWANVAAAIVMIVTVVMIPTMNARARRSDHRLRNLNLGIIAGAIVVPAVVVTIVAALPGTGGLMGVAVGVQILLLVASGLISSRSPEH